jgi:hypothetical protein
MDLTLLHKKLLSNWSAWTVSKSLSTNASLEMTLQSFNKLEKKTKMRVLLSLLNFDPKVKTDCQSSINELLRLATDEEKNGKVHTAATFVGCLSRLLCVDSCSLVLEMTTECCKLTEFFYAVATRSCRISSCPLVWEQSRPRRGNRSRGILSA